MRSMEASRLASRELTSSLPGISTQDDQDEIA